MPLTRLIALLRQYSFKTGSFTLASGRTSDFYIDVRRTALTAEGGAEIGAAILSALAEAGWEVAAVGGMTLGADPLATATAVTAYAKGIPMSSFIVRKAPKGHGAASQIELGGDIEPGARVVVLDDTVTTGGSTLRAIAVLREAGYQVVGAVAVVDREEGAAEAFSEAGIPFRALVTVNDLRGAS